MKKSAATPHFFLCTSNFCCTFAVVFVKRMNTFGQKIRFTDFGESHGVAVGGVLDGVPSRFKIDMAAIQHDLDRRAGRTGDLIVSERAQNEKDEVEFLSGLLDGVTLGSPIAYIIRNTDARSEDYEALKNVYRDGHADKVYELKYGIRDYRGGGRASARETVARVVAGSIAKQLLAQDNIRVGGQLVQIGEETDPAKFKPLLERVQQAGESIGGVVECRIKGLPAGVGEPIFDKLQARLAYAIMSINGCRSFSYDSGIVGGISDGEEIVFRCRFKATATTAKQYGGRHDVCIAVRAVPVVEAMTALAVLDIQSSNLQIFQSSNC